VKNRPAYALASVDAALLLATLLQQEGPMRVTDAAERLGVSGSTAHRLLGMLVYRDFAEQLPDRRYGPGRLMQHGEMPQAAVPRLRGVALPHLRRLVNELGETVSLTVLAGSEVRFVATVECDRVLRVGDRTGRALPAHLSSGGKAVLAGLSREELATVLEALDEGTATRLERELRSVRRRGVAVNDQETESGLTAVGIALRGGIDAPPAAISVAMPSVRYSRDRVPEWAAALQAAAEAIVRDLAAA
jgi:IclR family acetate operon transcriptional repressor